MLHSVIKKFFPNVQKRESCAWTIPKDFEMEPMGGKIDPAQEHRRLGGCGDPNCEWCNPKDGKGGKAPGGSGRPADIRPGGVKLFIDNGARDFSEMVEIQNDFIRSAFGLPSDRLTSSAETEEARAEKELARKLDAARSKVEQYLLKTSQDTNWDDVVGNERARTALLEAVEHPVKHAGLYEKYGIPAPKGVLLFGQPGNGKTMLAKATAAAVAKLHGTDVELLLINGPSIQSPWVGKTEETIRDIFAYARLYHQKHGHQLVIFIDEADAILPARDGGPMWNASNVATFLSEMDGMESNGAFVILATNRPHVLDQALLRDGRCDRKIKVERPDEEAAKTILRKSLDGAPLHEHGVEDRVIETLFDPMYLLQALKDSSGGRHHFTLGHIVSGAMVVGLVSRAKGIAFRRELAGQGTDGITLDDFRQAIDEVFQENHGLDHTYAMKDFIESIPQALEQRNATLN